MRRLLLLPVAVLALVATAGAATQTKVPTTKTSVIHEIRTNPNLARGHDIPPNTIGPIHCKRIVPASHGRAKTWQCTFSYTTTYTPPQHCTDTYRLGKVRPGGWNDRKLRTTCPTQGSSEEG